MSAFVLPASLCSPSFCACAPRGPAPLVHPPLAKHRTLQTRYSTRWAIGFCVFTQPDQYLVEGLGIGRSRHTPSVRVSFRTASARAQRPAIRRHGIRHVGAGARTVSGANTQCMAEAPLMSDTSATPYAFTHAPVLIAPM